MPLEDCPAIYGPPTTIYNRFNRWSWKGLWGRIFAELVARARNALVNGRAIFAVITIGRGAAFRTNLRGEQVGV